MIQHPPTTEGRETYVVASQVQMLALTMAVKGDVAVRTDINDTFLANAFLVSLDFHIRVNKPGTPAELPA